MSTSTAFNPVAWIRSAAVFVRDVAWGIQARDQVEYAMYREGYIPTEVRLISNSDGSYDSIPVAYETPAGEKISPAEYGELREARVTKLMAEWRGQQPQPTARAA